MEQANLNWIANFIRGIADDVLRDFYALGKVSRRHLADNRPAGLMPWSNRAMKSTG